MHFGYDDKSPSLVWDGALKSNQSKFVFHSSLRGMHNRSTSPPRHCEGGTTEAIPCHTAAVRGLISYSS